MNKKLVDELKMSELLDRYPFTENFFSENVIDIKGHENETFSEFLDKFAEEEIEDMALDTEKIKEGLIEYIEQMKLFLGMEEESGVEVLTIIAGKDKTGNPEGFERLDINNKLVAQLSQNMNFVMDLSVRDFLELHAKSRMIDDIQGVTDKIIEEANKLAGEQFNLDTPITALSGGQSRALMIADTAILSSSPIVLIDEIENAGIDRKKALDLLVSSDKIVLMATHDPTLALIADKRIIIKNGGISKIIKTSPEEKKILSKLEEMDNIIQKMRTDLRNGEILTDNK